MQHAVRANADAIAKRTRHRVPGRREPMPHLTDCDQGRERVADDRQTKMLKPGVRQGRELEGQLRRNN